MRWPLTNISNPSSYDIVFPLGVQSNPTSSNFLLSRSENNNKWIRNVKSTTYKNAQRQIDPLPHNMFDVLSPLGPCSSYNLHPSLNTFVVDYAPRDPKFPSTVLATCHAFHNTLYIPENDPPRACLVLWSTRSTRSQWNWVSGYVRQSTICQRNFLEVGSSSYSRPRFVSFVLL